MERIYKINKLIDSIGLYDYLEGTSEIKYKKENELKEEVVEIIEDEPVNSGGQEIQLNINNDSQTPVEDT